MNASFTKDAFRFVPPAALLSVAVAPAAAAEHAFRSSREVSRLSAEGTMAWIALSANQALTRQIEAAHRLGQMMATQSRRLGESGQALPEGPLRDAMTLAAQMEANLATTMVSLANQWGRRFGRLAFAFPTRMPTQRGA